MSDPDEPAGDGDPVHGAEGAARLETELTRVIDYFRSEYRMTNATAIGVLHILAHGIAREAFDDQDEPD